MRPPKLPPAATLDEAPPAGCRQRLEELGPERFAQWMCSQQRVLLTDTTMRDAHQSLLATRMRTIDMAAIAPAYAALLPQSVFGGMLGRGDLRRGDALPQGGSVGAAGGKLREAMPNLLLQMLLRSANAVGYTNYPDNVVRYFVQQSAAAGIDVFRVFDSLNWVENMRVAIDAVLESGRLCEAAICYSGNLSNPQRAQVHPGLLPQAGA